MANEGRTSQLLGVETISSTVGKVWSDSLQAARQYGPALLPTALEHPTPLRREEH